MTKRIAVYPGTFDPITYGHMDVIKRGTNLFDKVIVLVARNSTKTPLFSGDERVKMIRGLFKNNHRVSVDVFDGLLVEYVRRRNATAIIRGLRAVSDFEFEFQMALTNRKMDGTIDTIFLVPDERYTYLNSTIVREIARLGGDVSDFVPPTVRKYLTAKLKSLSRR
ncbi:MAG TPA: pantetheine-phosphate adenylyltransferase [Bacteroidetes bacterium]|jgi:pantetheine-phosphate adenylyltransferase|nr:pantetheine-phosphate adenylyltransferase [Bacteroidota bacterium]